MTGLAKLKSASLLACIVGTVGCWTGAALESPLFAVAAMFVFLLGFVGVVAARLQQ